MGGFIFFGNLIYIRLIVSKEQQMIVDPVDVIADFAGYLEVGLYGEMDSVVKREGVSAKLRGAMEKISKIFRSRLEQINVFEEQVDLYRERIKQMTDHQVDNEAEVSQKLREERDRLEKDLEEKRVQIQKYQEQLRDYRDYMNERDDLNKSLSEMADKERALLVRCSELEQKILRIQGERKGKFDKWKIELSESQQVLQLLREEVRGKFKLISQHEVQSNEKFEQKFCAIEDKFKTISRSLEGVLQGFVAVCEEQVEQNMCLQAKYGVQKGIVVSNSAETVEV